MASGSRVIGLCGGGAGGDARGGGRLAMWDGASVGVGRRRRRSSLRTSSGVLESDVGFECVEKGWVCAGRMLASASSGGASGGWVVSGVGCCGGQRWRRLMMSLRIGSG